MSELERELEDLGGADITSALDEVAVHSFLLDADGIVRWQNKAAREEIGDRVGMRWAAVLTERSVQDVEDVWRKLLCSGEPAEVTVDALLPDGTVERRDISAAPLREGGSVVGVFGIGVRAHPAGHSAVTTDRLGLTERQLEILQLLAEGKSTAQISAELFLSTTTVRNHVARILAGLGVHTRVQAIIVASRAGLIRLS